MYSKPQALPADDILTDGSIVVWVYWGFPPGGKPRDSDPFHPYPRPVCEELTKALLTKSKDVSAHVSLPDSDEYPADNASRKVGFQLLPEEEEGKGKYLQYNLVKRYKKRRCFPCPVRWLWCKSQWKGEWEPFPADVAWALERAYAESHATHQFTDSQGVERIVNLTGRPMFQVPLDRPCAKRDVRREGPALFPGQLGAASVGAPTPSVPRVTRQLTWVRGTEGAPLHRVQLDDEVERFATLMDCATQWHAFPELRHCNLGCVPGPGSVRTQKFRVEKVERVQAPDQWALYAARREELRAQNCGPLFPKAACNPQAWCPPLLTAAHFDAAAFYSKLGDVRAQLDSSVNEVLLFHGTQKDVINKVTCRESMSVCERTDVAGALGSGIYFADLASKSNLYVPCPNCGHGSYQCQEVCTCSSPPTYQMLLCRVLLGRIWQENEIRGEHSDYYKEDANLQRVLREYDSVFVPMEKELGNNTSCVFREWAVYASNHVYPEFVISYTRHKS